MDDLTAFVTARLDEDEAGAYEVHLPRACGCVDRDGDFSPDPVYCGCGYPARALREVTAKRRILYDHTPQTVGRRVVCSRCHYGNPLGANWVCLTMESLAAIWSDHPEYRQAWKPSQGTPGAHDDET